MDSLQVNKGKFPYEHEITKKIVSKILAQLETFIKENQEYAFLINKNKIINFFADAEILFRYYDITNSGELDIRLFPPMARALKQLYSVKDIRKFEKEIRVKKLHKMNLPIYLTLLKRKLFERVHREEMFDVHFNTLDMQHVGKVNLEQLKTFLKSVGDKVAPKQFDSFFSSWVENNEKLVKADYTVESNNSPKEIGKEAYKKLLTYYKTY